MTAPPPEQATEIGTLFLVGDAGEDNPARTTVLTHLAANVETVAHGGLAPPVTVVFLGDNVYDKGVRADHVDQDLDKLADQIDALPDLDNVRGVFMPGNHDWGRGAPQEEGLASIRRLAAGLATTAGHRDIQVLPQDGCPGPASLDLGEQVRLIFIDTEWLLMQPEDHCGSAEDFYRRLQAELEESRDRITVLMSHHPLATGGPHGGNVAPFQRGPLIFYLAIKSGASRQDLSSGAYSEMLRQLNHVFATAAAPPLLHAAGHDHNLQVLRLDGAGRPAYQLVSGSGSKSSNARRIDGTRYATNGFGYMRVDFDGDEVRLVVYAREPEGGLVRPVFSGILFPTGACSEAPRARGRP
jgi:hypothetical protein